MFGEALKLDPQIETFDGMDEVITINCYGVDTHCSEICPRPKCTEDASIARQQIVNSPVQHPSPKNPTSSSS